MKVATPAVSAAVGTARRRTDARTMAALFGMAAIAVVLVAPSAPANAFVMLVLAAVACVLMVIGLRNPHVAVAYLLIAMFLRLALPSVLPADPFVLAYVGVLASVGLWLVMNPKLLPRLGAVEAFMVIYLLWNIYSMFAPHEYLAAVYPLIGEELSVYRFILTGTAIPFTMYFVGRAIYLRDSHIRVLLWAVVLFGAYSALVSILQFTGPTELVWPRYIIDAPHWPGRANGVFNQPAANGLALIAGFLAALLIASQADEPRWRRWVANAIAVASAYAVYLTHTRAVWLSFFVVLLVGAVLAKGRMRTWFATSVGVVLVSVAVNWSTFTSSDREAGGVSSANEVNDRLNSARTSFWAFDQAPWGGWGIGRFTAVNSLHHKQWAPDIPWERGLGIASHFNELGILVELGLIGLALWLAVLVLVAVKLIGAFRLLPADGLLGRNFALTAILLFATLIVTGFTVDLRFFDFPNAMVMLVVGVAVGGADRLRAGRSRPRWATRRIGTPA